MAKKISFSVRNDDLEDMEKISKSTGKRVIEIIRERYESGKKSEDFNKKIDHILKDISIIKKDNEDKLLKIFSIFEVIVRQNIFSNEVLNAVVKGNKNEEELKLYEDSIERKCEDKIGQLRKNFFER